MSAPIIVGAVAGATPLLFESSTSIALLTVVPVGMWAKASISPLSELAREAGEAQHFRGPAQSRTLRTEMRSPSTLPVMPCSTSAAQFLSFEARIEPDQARRTT